MRTIFFSNYLASQISFKLVVDESKIRWEQFLRAYLHTGVNTANMKYVLR